MAIAWSSTAKGSADLSSLLRRGRRLLRKGDVVGAELCFRRAVALDTSSAEAWRALASTQLGARHAICVRWAEAALPVSIAAPAAAHRNRPLRAALTGVLALVGACGTLVVGTDIAWSRHVLPNVAIAGVAVGNLPLDRLDDAIDERQAQIAQRVVRLSAAGHDVRVPLGVLLRPSGDRLLSEAAAYGHAAGFADRAATRAQALGGHHVSLGRPELHDAAVERAVAAIAAAVERSPVAARLERPGGIWQIEPEQVGRSLDRAVAIRALHQLIEHSAWSMGDSELALPLHTRTIRPRLKAAQLLPIRERLRELAARPLSVVAGEQAWTLDPSTMVRFDAGAGAGSVRPDPVAIDAQLEPIAAALLVPPQPSRLEREGRRVRSLIAGLPGRGLDRQAASGLIGDSIATAGERVELPLRELEPPAGEIEQLGLLAELGRGESEFVSYSSPNRDANVLAGGRDVDGVLVAPGEVFSFNDTIGWIGEDKGYRWGEAIENGVVVPSIGGGICQVSTTVFRAAFWSGLHIVERHNHMWRLPWYETDAPPGMDATIALGGPDLRFRNDTGHHILIRVETDLVNKRQTVIFVGTPDGRRVEMQPLAGGTIGVHRSIVGANGALADQAFVSYYTR